MSRFGDTPVLSIVLTAYEKDVNRIPAVLECLRAQTDKNYELIPVIKGTPPPAKWFAGVCEQVYTTEPNPTMGNFERRHGLICATGDKVCWVSADNLLFPDFVEQHNRCRNQISIVNTHYWNAEGYCGVFPRELALCSVDLLNFALDRELAYRVDAFNSREYMLWETDWAALDRAMKLGVTEWNTDAPPCAVHL